MEEAKKKGRGGARPGAGRKINVSGEKKTIMKNYNFQPRIVRFLNSVQNETFFIENAIFEKCERDGIVLVS